MTRLNVGKLHLSEAKTQRQYLKCNVLMLHMCLKLCLSVLEIKLMLNPQEY